MWKLRTIADAGNESAATVAGGLGATIVATENGSLLKRSFKFSKSLPPADVRKYTKGKQVVLKSPPKVAAEDPDYWLVEVL